MRKENRRNDDAGPATLAAEKCERESISTVKEVYWIYKRKPWGDMYKNGCHSESLLSALLAAGKSTMIALP